MHIRNGLLPFESMSANLEIAFSLGILAGANARVQSHLQGNTMHPEEISKLVMVLLSFQNASLLKVLGTLLQTKSLVGAEDKEEADSYLISFTLFVIAVINLYHIGQGKPPPLARPFKGALI